MIDGDLKRSDPILVVGFEDFHDFYPELIADNLIEFGVPAKSIRLKLSEILNSKVY